MERKQGKVTKFVVSVLKENTGETKMIGRSFVERIDEFKNESCKKCGHRLGVHTLGGYCPECNKGCGDILEISTFKEKVGEKNE